MFRALAFLCTCLVAQSVFAQNSASSSGANSPAINAEPGSKVGIEYNQITNYYGTPAEKIKAATRNEKDPTFVRANRLVSEGRYRDALHELERFSSQERGAVKKLALAKYLEGQIHTYDERLDKADQSFSTALDLAPENCSYRFSKGHSLMNLGRLWEAERLLAESHTGTSSCLASGTPVEIANLHIVSARVQFELRDRAATYDQMDRAYRAIKNHKGYSDWAEPTCLLSDLVRFVPSIDRSRWPGMLESCVTRMQQPASTTKTIVAERAKFYAAVNDGSNTALSIGQELLGKWKVADDLDVSGMDVVRKRMIHGAFLSDLGFQTLWTTGDAIAAGDLYLKAFDELEPLISFNRNSTIVEVMGLINRVVHLYSMKPLQALANAEPRFVKAIGRARKHLHLDGSYRACYTLDSINRSSKNILTIAPSDAELEQAEACFTRVVTPKSWTAATSYFDKVSADTEVDMNEHSLRKRIEVRKTLFGFPSKDSVHADQANDLMLLSMMLKRTQGSASVERIEIINQAILEAAKEPSLDRGAHVISRLAKESTLPVDERNALVLKAFVQISEEQTWPDNSIHQCVFEQRKSETYSYVLAHALQHDLLDLITSSAIAWKTGMSLVRKCIEHEPQSDRFGQQIHDHLIFQELDFGITQMSLGKNAAKAEPVCYRFTVCNSLRTYPKHKELLLSTIGDDEKLESE